MTPSPLPPFRSAEPDAPRRAPAPMLAAGIAAAALALVLAIGTMLDRLPFAVDRALLSRLRVAPGEPAGPAWLHPFMLDVTALGSPTVLTLAVLIAVGLLVVERLWLTAALVAAGTISGSLAVVLVKQHVSRARPPAVERLAEVSGMSFPSGHAANSAIVYLTIAALATQVTPGARNRAYLFGVAVLLVGLIGASRVYLGVHWASDVAAGWSFGTLWAVAWWTAGTQARGAMRHRQG